MPAPVSMRRRLAPAAAATMALAVGIAVGAGPLSDVGTGTDQLAARTGQDDAPGVGDAETRDALEAADALAAAAAPGLYADALAGRTVALVTMPGAEPAVVDGVRQQLGATGARVSATYRVTDELVATGGKALVDSLGARLLEQQPDLPVDAGAPTYERIGGLLGMVAASTRVEGQEPVPATVRVGSGLAEAGLVTGPDEARTRAPYVVVVLGSDGSSPENSNPDQSGTDAVVSGLVTGLAERSAGTVVTDGAASGDDGALRRLREAAPAAERGWSTLAGADRLLGQVLAGLAVVAVADGAVGDWGTSGDDGVVPLPAP